MSRRSDAEVERIIAQYEREITRINMLHGGVVQSLTEAHTEHTAGLMAQIEMLQNFINPQVEAETPPEFEQTEEAEHLAYTAHSGGLDPKLLESFQEIGLDPTDLTIEGPTD
jgi:hypothetical protein